MNLKVTTTGMGYAITAHALDGATVASFEVEDIERTAWGLMATVTARTSIRGARALTGGFVAHERLNLLNARARKDFARTLDDRIPPPKGGAAIGWEEVAEDLALHIMDAEKRPLSVLNLATIEPAGEDNYLLPGILPIGKPTILYGAGGTGKSIMALAMACAIQEGVSFLGWSTQQANVLYLDWETDERDMAGRLRLVSAGLGLKDPAPIRYISLSQPLETHQSEVAAIVADPKHPIGMVVVDSTAMATVGARDGGDLAAGATKFFRSLRALKVAALAIDHISGDDLKKGNASKPFGSIFKVNNARNTFELQDITDTSIGGHQLVMRHRKTNLGPRMDDLTIDVTWEEKSVRFTRSTYTPTATPLHKRVYDALWSGAASPRALVDVLNDEPGEDRVSEYEVRQEVSRLRRDGVVLIDHSGVVRLAPEAEEPKQEEPNLGLTAAGE